MEAEVVTLRPDDVTTIVAARGSFSGYINGGFSVFGYDTPQDTVTWTVNASGGSTERLDNFDGLDLMPLFRVADQFSRRLNN